MSNDDKIDLPTRDPDEDRFDLVSEMLSSHQLHTRRLDMLLRRWIEAVQVVDANEDMLVLDLLRHQVKLALDDTTHEHMLRSVSIAVASQMSSGNG